LPPCRFSVRSRNARRRTEISAPPHPLPSSGGSGTREEWRYDIAALVKAARCRKILKLKILNGDIRVRDIGGRQLSCSWWLLRSRGRRRGGEGGGRERSGGGRAALAPRVGVLYGERSRRETNEDGGDWSRKGGGETKWRDIVSRLRGHRYFKISSRARKGGGRGIHRGPRVRAHVRGVPEVTRARADRGFEACARNRAEIVGSRSSERPRFVTSLAYHRAEGLGGRGATSMLE